MGKTSIQWTERTWNPTTGCDRVSAGCLNCYALTRAAMNKAAGSRYYQQDGNPITSGPGFALTLHADRLTQPLHWRKPSLVFVNSMSDLFHEAVPLGFLQEVFAVMERCPQHTFQILTKRATRLTRVAAKLRWPDNVWMGVSVEDQVQVERRARRLLRVPAAVRWLSVEPMIGPVDLGGVFWRDFRQGNQYPDLHWVVMGGESGPAARLLDPGWMRELKRQCDNVGVPVFVKQLGTRWARQVIGKATNGGEIDRWPEDLRVREWPEWPR